MKYYQINLLRKSGDFNLFYPASRPAGILTLGMAGRVGGTINLMILYGRSGNFLVDFDHCYYCAKKDQCIKRNGILITVISIISTSVIFIYVSPHISEYFNKQSELLNETISITWVLFLPIIVTNIICFLLGKILFYDQKDK